MQINPKTSEPFEMQIQKPGASALFILRHHSAHQKRCLEKEYSNSDGQSFAIMGRNMGFSESAYRNTVRISRTIREGK